MAIDDLETRLRRAARSHEHIKSIGKFTRAEVADILRVDSVRQPELLADGNVRRRISGQCLGHGRYDGHHQPYNGYKCLFHYQFF